MGLKPKVLACIDVFKKWLEARSAKIKSAPPAVQSFL